MYLVTYHQCKGVLPPLLCLFCGFGGINETHISFNYRYPLICWFINSLLCFIISVTAEPLRVFRGVHDVQHEHLFLYILCCSSLSHVQTYTVSNYHSFSFSSEWKCKLIISVTHTHTHTHTVYKVTIYTICILMFLFGVILLYKNIYFLNMMISSWWKVLDFIGLDVLQTCDLSSSLLLCQIN